MPDRHDVAYLPPYEGKFRSVLLFGPPGAGKGTIGKTLSQVGNLCHISSGDIFRGLSPESPAGKLVRGYTSKGLLVPDEVTIEIWYEYVSGLMSTNRYFPQQQLLLLDGLPRTSKQAELLDQYIEVEAIIVLKIDDTEELAKRLRRRSLIEKRTDDADPEVLKTRLRVYEEQTRQVLAHYTPRVIYSFDGAQRPLQVLRDVLVNIADMLSVAEAPKA